MADTTPDVSHKDQMSLIIRYVTDDFEVHERLLNITTLSDKSGDGLAKMVLQCFKELNLPTSGLRFQCYDTTASISGVYRGAQAKLSERLQRKIPYIPCLGHKSNLCVEHACNESLLAHDFFPTLQQLYSFMTKSTTRFERYKDDVMVLQGALLLKGLSQTRWTRRAEAISLIHLLEKM